MIIDIVNFSRKYAQKKTFILVIFTHNKSLSTISFVIFLPEQEIPRYIENLPDYNIRSRMPRYSDY